MAENKTPGVDTDTDGQTEPNTPDTQTDTEVDLDSPEEETETETQDTGEDAAAETAAPEKVVIEREKVIETRSGFGSALFGGIVAACAGFILARAEFLDPYLPDVLKSADMTEELTDLQSALSQQGDVVAALNEKVDGISLPDIGPIESRLEELSANVTPLEDGLAAASSELSALGERLTEVEKRPIDEGVSEAAIAAYERELSALQSAMATQRSEVESLIEEARAVKAEAGELEANAAAAAQRAANRATMAKLRAALDGGAPFQSEVEELGNAGVDVPAELAAVAADGVATLTALSTSFPAASRSALAAARAETVDEDRGVQSFLKRQLGARSVQPREGDDPDAVLSRAEAAITSGQLQVGLDEISKLPEGAQAAMSAWIEHAHTRLSAATAADALAESLNSN